jgi:hypothetical protein
LLLIGAKSVEADNSSYSTTGTVGESAPSKDRERKLKLSLALKPVDDVSITS